jgi:hypothetical protein
MPPTNTVDEPTLITAECGTQAGPDGIVCGATGLPLHSTAMPLAYTCADAPVGPITVDTESHPWPVVVESPFLATAGILLI